MKSILAKIKPDSTESLARNPVIWVALIVVVAVVWGMPPQREAMIFPDSASYLEMSTTRMPVFPVVAGVFGHGAGLVWFHFFVSLAAWCCLGWVVARALGVLIGACIAVSVPIMIWNIAVLSESLCLSLLVATLAATILLFRRWSWWRFALWCLLSLLFSFTRTSNMFLVPLLTVPFLVTSKRQFLYVAIAAVAVIAAADTYSRTRGASLRRVSLINIYTDRLLRNNNSREFLTGRGMPLNPDMEQFVDKTGRENGRALFETCPDFAEWFEENGTGAYYKWLFFQPYNYIAPAVSLSSNLDFLNLQYAEGAEIRLLSAYTLRFYDSFFVPWWIWVVGLFLPLISWRIYGRVTPESLFVPALMLALYVQAYVALHGDRAEISRHMLVALVLYRITLWLILAAAVTMFLEWRRRRPAAAARPSGKPRKKDARRKRSKRRR
jgi:hypothetical protein